MTALRTRVFVDAQKVRSATAGADRGVRLVGLVAAAASATFAGYMISTDRSHPSSSGGDHVAMFTQPLRTRGSDAPFVANLPQPTQPREAAPATIDYSPVGSIDGLAGEDRASRRAGSPREGVTGSSIPGYRLRQVRDGVASLDGPDGTVDVGLGAVLRRAGRVKAIELRAGRWTVVTSDGVIVERP